MALGLVSPGVKVREVDLTNGRVGSSSQVVGAVAGPFVRGPVEEPVLIENEQQLIDIFGKPELNSNQYEYWYTASNYLTYGGTLRVVRCDGTNLGNANSPVGAASSLTSVKIKNYDDYISQSSSSWHWAAKTPGTWANDVKVCVIDNFADQTLSGVATGITTSITQVSLGTTTVTLDVVGDTNLGVTTAGFLVGDIISGTYILANTTILGIGNSSITISQGTVNTGIATTSVLASFTRPTLVSTTNVIVGTAVTQSISGGIAGIGTTSGLNGYLKGIVTGVGVSEIYVKVLSQVSSTGIETSAKYSLYSFTASSAISIGNTTASNGIGAPNSLTYQANVHQVTDWYNSQTLGLNNSIVYWNSIAPKPGTSAYASARSSSNDEMHIVVVDDSGSVSGISGNILEKWIGLSKATDAQLSPQEKVYYRDYLASTSNYIYGGADPNNLTAVGYAGTGGKNWNQLAQGVDFNVCGKRTYSLLGGNSYGGRSSSGYITPEYNPELGDVINSYKIFTNRREFDINFLMMGSGYDDKLTTQAKANELIAIASNRKDCIAVISPHRSSVVNITNTTTQTNNIIGFFDGLSSSSYAVFDSGYKYMFDRFNNKFVYVPMNGDIAGCMCRTTLNDFPWFSPAGSKRGVINGAVKLAYNPSQAQRDELYIRRINPVIYSPGSGIILFGDKTGLAQASAFDRINVRRLFISLESSIEAAARDQLFEFNDSITRSNFVNIVEPYLRDVQAKRGITDFIVICDETNNTPDVIDSNEFRADIFVKPARSINFIGLTFVATRTGVSFEEVVGRV
jgi:hypothetical protein